AESEAKAEPDGGQRHGHRVGLPRVLPQSDPKEKRLADPHDTANQADPSPAILSPDTASNDIGPCPEKRKKRRQPGSPALAASMAAGPAQAVLRAGRRLASVRRGLLRRLARRCSGGRLLVVRRLLRSASIRSMTLLASGSGADTG